LFYIFKRFYGDFTPSRKESGKPQSDQYLLRLGDFLAALRETRPLREIRVKYCLK